MEVYVEFKPCSLTIYDYDMYGDWTAVRHPNDFRFNQLHIVDGKCDSPYWNVTDDYKYVYGFYNWAPTYWRICNISSTPIIHKTNKVKIWKEYAKKINSLIEERNKLMR